MSGANFQLLLASGGSHAPEIDSLFTANSGTSHSISLGPEDSSRIIVVGLRSSAGVTMTLGGLAMTKVAGGATTATVWAIAFPTGTTATLALSSVSSTVSVYAIYGMSGASPFANGTAAAFSVSINTPANGVAVAAFDTNNVASFTAGITTTDISGSGFALGRTSVMASANTPLTITATGGGVGFQRISAASWGP